MKRKKIIAAGILVILFIVSASFASPLPAKRFKPEGMWQYSAPSAPEGYTTGMFVIEKGGEGYIVTFVLGEYYKVKANSVVYKKKALDFTIYLENEMVRISGSFEDEKFTGTASYSEGVIDITAVRKVENK